MAQDVPILQVKRPMAINSGPKPNVQINITRTGDFESLTTETQKPRQLVGPRYSTIKSKIMYQ